MSTRHCLVDYDVNKHSCVFSGYFFTQKIINDSITNSKTFSVESNFVLIHISLKIPGFMKLKISFRFFFRIFVKFCYVKLIFFIFNACTLIVITYKIRSRRLKRS